MPAPTTLETVPEVVDGSWWRRHAHLIRMGSRGLDFEAGQPISGGAGGAGGAGRPPSHAGFDLATFRAAFAGLVGQESLLQRFEAAAKGSAARGRAFPHTLLTGPAGAGKTTLANALGTVEGPRLPQA